MKTEIDVNEGFLQLHSSGDTTVATKPSFAVSSPRFCREKSPHRSGTFSEAKFTVPLPKVSLPDVPEISPRSPYSPPQFPDLWIFQLPKTEIMTFDGNPLNHHLFIKTFKKNVKRFTADDDLRLKLQNSILLWKSQGNNKELWNVEWYTRPHKS